MLDWIVLIHMDIVVNCLAGMAFLLFQDASLEKHDRNYIYKFVERGMNVVDVGNIM